MKSRAGTRRDPNCVVLPHFVFRNGAHIVALCKATDEKGRIAAHQNLAKDNAMLGMMANAEIRAPSLAIFVRGTHEVGAFIELLCQHQCETENKEKENKFWILHGFLDWPTEESPLGKWSTQALAHGQRCQLPFLRTWKPALGRIRLRSPPHKPTQSTTSPRSTARVTWNRVLCSSRHPAQTITMSTGWVLPRPEWQCCIYLRTLDQMRMLSS